MTPITREQRHLKFGRFGRHTEASKRASEGFTRGRRGRWTGYRPLSDAVAEARLRSLIDSADSQTEESR
jgi:hypothetical protein